MQPLQYNQQYDYSQSNDLWANPLSSPLAGLGLDSGFDFDLTTEEVHSQQEDPIEGQMRVENSVVEVYTGSGEGQGWRNVELTEHFQGGEGRSVFFRQGEAGSYTYLKIEDLVVDIKLGLADSSRAGTGHTWLIESDDIVKAGIMFTQQFGSYTISTLGLATHGASDEARTGIGTQGKLGTSQGGDGTRLSMYGIENAYEGKQLEISDEEYADAKAFNTLVGAVVEGGTLIIGGCNIGTHDDFLKIVAKVTRSNVMIYANKDSTRQTSYSDGKYTFKSDPFQFGWVRWDVINEDKVKEKGRKPKYGSVDIGNREWTF